MLFVQTHHSSQASLLSGGLRPKLQKKFTNLPNNYGEFRPRK